MILGLSDLAFGPRGKYISHPSKRDILLRFALWKGVWQLELDRHIKDSLTVNAHPGM